jgi:hypothetical protein
VKSVFVMVQLGAHCSSMMEFVTNASKDGLEVSQWL